MPFVFAASVLLHLGVHVEAGGVYDVAVDGAAGQCSAGPSWLRCPATGPVRFRWGPGESSGWTLTGDTELQPDTEGTAWVLATEERAADARAALAVDQVTPEAVRSWFVREGTHHPPAPSAGALSDLVALASHPDPLVRREVVEALHPWWWRSELGPLPPTAPVPLPAGLIDTLSRDPDAGVRRRLAAFLRDARESHLAGEAAEALVRLTHDPVKGVRRAALASLTGATHGALLTGEEAWEVALAEVPQPLGPGRAAASTLARLASSLEPSEAVDPRQAVEIVLAHHPEQAWKVWNAWRQDVPFHRPWADVLLRETLGMGPGLVRHWSTTSPEALAEALEAWEPAAPHSERFEILQRSLWDVRAPAVRAALELPAEIARPAHPKKPKKFELVLPERPPRPPKESRKDRKQRERDEKRDGGDR